MAVHLGPCGEGPPSTSRLLRGGRSTSRRCGGAGHEKSARVTPGPVNRHGRQRCWGCLLATSNLASGSLSTEERQQTPVAGTGPAASLAVPACSARRCALGHAGGRPLLRGRPPVRPPPTRGEAIGHNVLTSGLEHPRACGERAIGRNVLTSGLEHPRLRGEPQCHPLHRTVGGHALRWYSRILRGTYDITWKTRRARAHVLRVVVHPFRICQHPQCRQRGVVLVAQMLSTPVRRRGFRGWSA